MSDATARAHALEEERDRLLYELKTNVVVAAGAGTGKTHRLTGLYVHLVGGLTDASDGALSPESIVATTFTREAAAEMRGRIEGRLRLLSAQPLSQLVERPEPAISAWARELAATCKRRSVPHPPCERWRRALDGLPRATITTFHAWAGELLRAYPIEAGVPPGFSLVEPEEADALVARALGAAIAKWIDDASELPKANAIARPIARRDAIRMLMAGGADRLEEAVVRALGRAAEEGIELTSVDVADDPHARDLAIARRSALLDALDDAARAAQRTPKKSPELLAHAREARASIGGGDVDEACAQRFAESVKSIHRALGGGALSAERDAINALLEAGAMARKQTIPERARRIAQAPRITERAATLGGAARVLLAEVASSVTSAKRRARVLDFGDVLRRARDVLLQSPELQLEVASSVRALLVDEFQDTNALQRDLVYLVHQRPDAIARRAPGVLPDPTTLRPTGLFVVGDRKQSIYSFRGADVGVFQQMLIDLAGEDAAALLGIGSNDAIDANDANDAQDHAAPEPRALGRLVTLEDNRRSVEEVLGFVNLAAEADMLGHDDLAPIERVVFSPERESLRAVRRSGRAVTARNLRVAAPTIRLDAASSGEVGKDLAACLALATELRKLLDDPARGGLDGDPPLRPRDVVILVRTYAILPSLELALSCHGIDYAVAARRGLYGTTEAGDLHALVRLAVDDRDRNALLAALRGPWVGLSDTALLALCGDHGLDLGAPSAPAGEGPFAASAWSALSDGERRRARRLHEALEELRVHGSLLGAGAALRRAVERMGVEPTLALLPRGEQRIGDLRRLLEIADATPGGLSAFARHLDRARRGDVDDARGAVFDREDDVVRVMTVHASKGLEFRVVAVMQLEHGGRPGDSAPVLLGRRGGAHEAGDVPSQLVIAARLELDGAASTGCYGEGGRALSAHARAIDRAERQRLTYVAFTRARDLLWVVAGGDGSFVDHSAAYSVHRRMAVDDAIVSRPVWTPLSRSAPRANDVEKEREDARALAALVPAFGVGAIQASTHGSVVVTTALADFQVCPRRFRLLHLVGIDEQPPLVPVLGGGGRGDGDGDEGAARAGDRSVHVPRVQLALFGATPKGDDAVDGVPSTIDLDLDAPDDAEAEGAVAPGTSLPVGPPPIDPRVQGVVAHLALERAPLPASLGPSAGRYASEFLRSEGYDPDGEPGRALTQRIARFLGGPYASTLVAPGVEVRRELPFLVELPSGVSLRGTIDLLVLRRAGGRDGGSRVEVVDYKLRDGDRTDLSRYDLQLRAYAVAASIGAPEGTEVVAGVAFLGQPDGDGTPLWLDGGADLSDARAIGRIDEVARKLLEARATGVWPMVDRARCDRFACGFRGVCFSDVRKERAARGRPKRA